MATTVFLIEDNNTRPGTIYAIFSDYEDAVTFLVVSELEESAEIVERTLFYGQPPNPGYNE